MSWESLPGSGKTEGNQIALQFNGTESSDLSHRYLWGPAVDQILADEQVTSLNNAGDILWPLVDNLGTVRDLASYDSQNDTTTVANHITYDSFGKVLSESDPAYGDRFKFTGREYDSATGLYYYRARYYDPAVGRFISQDPIGFSGGDTNVYRYAGNSPPYANDPLGLKITYPPNIPDYQQKMYDQIKAQIEWMKEHASQEIKDRIKEIEDSQIEVMIKLAKKTSADIDGDSFQWKTIDPGDLAKMPKLGPWKGIEDLEYLYDIWWKKGWGSKYEHKTHQEELILYAVAPFA